MSIQTESDRARFRRLRDALARAASDVRQLIGPFLEDSPLVKGCVYELKRKCGKSGCRCTRGALHARIVLSASEGGRTRLRAIPRGSVGEVRKKVERYQRLRKARAKLVKLHEKMLETLDELERIRRQEME